MKKINNAFLGWLEKPAYPLLIGAYPVLALLAVNAGQVEVVGGVRALIVSMAFSLVLFLVVWLLMGRQIHKAAFLTSALLGLFFTYGHAFIYIDETFPENDYTKYVLFCWGILFVLAVFWATRPKLNFALAAPTINVMALALIVMSVFQLDLGFGSHAHALGADNAPIKENLSAPKDAPDVYYFLLDSYGRDDVLQIAYGYDNSEFLNDLRERGFYVAECSQSNYVRTEVSLTSTLNMMYLQDLDSDFTPKNIKRSKLWDALKHNAVRYNFDSMGYQTVNAASGFAWLEVSDSDLFLSPPPLSSGMNEFEGLYLRTTFARYAQDWGWVDPDAVMGQGFRDRFNNIFDNIPMLTELPGSQFNYLHLISPHPPFVFDGEGKPTYPADFWNEQRQYPYDLYKQGYTNQVTYLNQKILEAVDIILTESETPPIIVIQGDHGPWMQPKDRRMWILNAYYLPGHTDKLYSDITPVNTFRLIFNLYFGGNYEILNDVSYFSPVPNLYDFSEIPNNCK